jgi:hypothetical protein
MNRVCLVFRYSSHFQQKFAMSLVGAFQKAFHGLLIRSICSEALESLRGGGAYAKIKEKKKLFREPQSARDVEAIIHLHRIPIKPLPRMELSCFVFGRKMSEGINFANEMARFVFIVGFPYPDITESNKWTGELRVPEFMYEGSQPRYWAGYSTGTRTGKDKAG